MSTSDKNKENRLIIPYVSPLKLRNKLDYILEVAGVAELDKSSYWSIFEEISQIAKQLSESPSQRDSLLEGLNMSLEERLDKFIFNKVESAKKKYGGKKSNSERLAAKEKLKKIVERNLREDGIVFNDEEIRTFVDSSVQLLEDVSFLPERKMKKVYERGEQRILSIFNRPGKSKTATA